MTVVAFLGLGRMGAPMAANIARAGVSLCVWNRTASKAEAFADEFGSRYASTPALAAEGADVVISMLADDATVIEAHAGIHGSLQSLRPGGVVVDMSTIGVSTVRELSAAVSGAGSQFVDAPVSGSVDRATAGELLIMVGGDADALKLAQDTLEALGTPVHLGASGAGAAMKLSLNSVVHGLNGAVSEALVLAERSGISRTDAYDIFTRSVIAAPFVHFRRPSFERPGEVPVAFRLDLAAKDLRCAVELAQSVGAELPQTQRNLEVLEAAGSAGFGDRDETAVAAYLRENTATTEESDE